MTRKLLVWGLAGAVLAACATILILAPFARSVAYWPWMLTPVAAMMMAALILSRSPGNVVAILMALTAVTQIGAVLGWTIVLTVGSDGQAAWAETIARAIASAGIFFLPLAGIRFPDGRLISRRWRAADALMVVTMMLAFAAALLNGGWLGQADGAIHPSPLRATAFPWGDRLALAILPLSVAISATTCAAVIVRFRRSQGEARQQLKYLVFAAALVLITFSLTGRAFDRDWENVVGGVATLLIPVAMAVAILRYRLYDIDLVISRTLVYGAMAVFITGVYVVLVVGVDSLVGSADRPDTVLSVAATSVVALAFQPLRRRLQQVANRLVYGRKATPYQVLSDFSRRLSVTDEHLIDQVARSLADGTSARSAEVWIRSGDRLHRRRVWPPDEAIPEPVAASAGAVPGADLTAWITHDGERLGALALSFPRGQQAASLDKRLLAELASGMGLALRNAALTEDLKSRVEELRESRRRIVAVQDQTRRQLERDLHDGAQQQLVALKVKLSLARRMAANTQAARTAEVLEGLNQEADNAIQAMRDLARGIYPPLLEAEGLPAAVAALARRLPLPVSVDASGLGRYPQQLESTVYFCIIEALHNTVKHARAGSAHVSIREEGDELVFSIRDDGTGFDSAAGTGNVLLNLADRLDANNGQLEVRSTSGGGTSILGRIPLSSPISA
jgi:signal transduction histidine kinase